MTSGSRRRFLSGTTALLLNMLGLRAHGENESGADSWDLTRLMRELAVVRSARARFTETK